MWLKNKLQVTITHERVWEGKLLEDQTFKATEESLGGAIFNLPLIPKPKKWSQTLNLFRNFKSRIVTLSTLRGVGDRS
jgi:hypothetical protein